jgi:hypothetical protein
MIFIDCFVVHWVFEENSLLTKDLSNSTNIPIGSACDNHLIWVTFTISSSFLFLFNQKLITKFQTLFLNEKCFCVESISMCESSRFKFLGLRAFRSLFTKRISLVFHLTGLFFRFLRVSSNSITLQSIEVELTSFFLYFLLYRVSYCSQKDIV